VIYIEFFFPYCLCRDPPHRNTDEQLYFRFPAFLYTHIYRPRPHALASMSATPLKVTVHCAARDMSLTVCLSVTVKWLAVKTASEMTYTVSGGVLNSAQYNPIISHWDN